MGKKTISIKLSEAGIDKAISELNSYKQEIERKTELLARKLAERLQEEADFGFNNAISDTLVMKGMGLAEIHLADVSVSIEPKGNNAYAVVAVGDEVAFIEFGAGVYFNGSAGSSPHPQGAELGMTIGGFGEGYGKREAWGYTSGDDHIVTRGVPAQMPMSKAMSTVINSIYSIAKEVFR